MFAARTGPAAAGNKIAVDDNAKMRKYSVVSLSSRDKFLKGVSDNGKGKRHSTAGQAPQRARRFGLMRELEMNWYLSAFELSYEHTVGITTGMPYR
ncbi:hypothetical protein NDU88_001282 [Pleurodeles waltl]|uniref:Uncharacterized protein n=1 Tax=Pleurodeles waltl TaxID=8319 RepID=A0AAV7LH14_PLEWA|nr:hypothetical protein NDU88_001282 [Pleurodeles waltl]